MHIYTYIIYRYLDPQNSSKNTGYCPDVLGWVPFLRAV